MGGAIGEQTRTSHRSLDQQSRPAAPLFAPRGLPRACSVSADTAEKYPHRADQGNACGAKPSFWFFFLPPPFPPPETNTKNNKSENADALCVPFPLVPFSLRSKSPPLFASFPSSSPLPPHLLLLLLPFFDARPPPAAPAVLAALFFFLRSFPLDRATRTRMGRMGESARAEKAKKGGRWARTFNARPSCPFLFVLARARALRAPRGFFRALSRER